VHTPFICLPYAPANENGFRYIMRTRRREEGLVGTVLFVGSLLIGTALCFGFRSMLGLCRMWLEELSRDSRFSEVADATSRRKRREEAPVAAASGSGRSRFGQAESSVDGRLHFVPAAIELFDIYRLLWRLFRRRLSINWDTFARPFRGSVDRALIH
jgi:hypothetical protein